MILDLSQRRRRQANRRTAITIQLRIGDRMNSVTVRTMSIAPASAVQASSQNKEGKREEDE